MLTLLAISVLTLTYLLLGREGMSRLEREREGLAAPRRLPMVSVVIPAFRSQKAIGHTLKSARDLDYPRKEIIVVNDSIDSTPVIAERYGARVLQNNERKGKPLSLNRATVAARGELILVLDSDTTIAPDALKRMVPWFSRKEVAAVMPRYGIRRDTPISGLAGLENTLTFALLRIHMFFRSLVGFRGCCVLIRRDILRKHPWPNALLEDNQLAATLSLEGYRMIWEPSAMTWTSEPESIRELRRQKRRWGDGAYRTFRKKWRFYLASPQFMLFIYPYMGLSVLAGLLFIALFVSCPLFPALSIPILWELLSLIAGVYIHLLLLYYVDSGRIYPWKTVRFMAVYIPVAGTSYLLGILSGIRRKRKGEDELHFGDW